MAGINKIDFSDAEIMTPDKTKVETVEVGSTKVARITAQPGWIWDECIKPVAGTDSCQAHHLGIIQKGQLKVMHEDGSEVFLNSGDVYEIWPGHHAEVVGDIPCSMVEFNSQAAAQLKWLNFVFKELDNFLVTLRIITPKG